MSLNRCENEAHVVERSLGARRPEWASVALDNKSKYTHINGIENAVTWSQKRADEYWAKRA